nr:hypothetical protein [Tanacetum cinerariifolium]
MTKKGNAVKASVCWIWKPKQNSTAEGNISYLSNYKPFDGGYVSFGQGGCKITGKGTIKTECLVLGRDFKLINDTNVLLRTPRQHNMYSIDLNNIVPHKDLTYLVAKAFADECMLWHRKLGHLNFKTMNKLVRHNLVRGLPTKCFGNNHTCIACLKGKQPKASCKTKLVNSVTKPLHTLHMDLFGPTSVSSISHKWYCLVVTDDFSRFTWTFFLKTKDETSGILRKFINEIKNLKDLKVKIIRCDNGGEFRNKEMNDLCARKGIKREFSKDRTPQVLVNKSQNKTPYKVFNGRTPAIEFLKPFGCHVMILNTLDHLGKFKAKGDEGYFIGYSMSSKAFKVFNKRTKRVEENLHIDFLENKAIKKGAGLNLLFNIDSLTNSINYVPVVVVGTHSTNFLGTKDAASQEVKKDVSSLRYIALPNWVHDALFESFSSNAQDTCKVDAPESNGNLNPTASTTNPPADQLETLPVETSIPIVSLPVLTACLNDSSEPSSLKISLELQQIQMNRMEWKLIPIETKWVLKNKKDERGIVIRNKARLVAQGHTQEERINYDEVFALFARNEATKLFLAYASFMGFTVYQMDVKSVFLNGTINEEVEFEALMHEKFQMSAMGELNFFLGMQVLQKEDGIFLSQDKKDRTGKDVDLHLYRPMIRSLMYMTASRPDIMFAICACARHQVTPKECHLHAVKRIFRYLKGHPKLGLWYPKESPFDLVAYSDSDYGGATQDHKSTIEGCQFLGRRLISWQCKKQTIVATSTTEAEYVAAASGCGQVLWIQNLAFCDYHNMIAILDKYEQNADFHQIVDFVEASHIRYALTFNTIVYVSHIRQFWSTARIETTDEGTKILAIVDGKLRTISKSSIKRNLKIKDKAGISSLPDTELFENLTPMGYNILPNQKFSFQKGQNKANIIKTSTLPYESTLRVTSLAANEGSMQHQIQELMVLCTSLQRQQTELVYKFEAQDLEINSLNEGEEAGIEKSMEKGSNDTDEMWSGSHCYSFFTTATVATQYTRRKGKEKMVESETPKKKKIQEQIDVQMARQVEEEMKRDAQRMNEQIAKDAEIAKIHAEEELQIMIYGLDRNNETIAKYLEEYYQFAGYFPIRERIELISDLVKYQDNYAKVLKYQTQQRKPLTKKQQREFYTSILRNQAGWKAKHFKGMTLEEIKEKFDPDSAKKQKTSEEVPEEKLKEMMQLVPVEEVYVKALQGRFESTIGLSEGASKHQAATSDKEIKLWVELKRLYEPDVKDQL